MVARLPRICVFKMADDCPPSDVGRNYDEAIKVQVENIHKEIADMQSLVSEKMDICVLGKEYSADDYIYQSKIKDLALNYSHVRKTRGDGNCFYRAFGFAYMELLIGNQAEYDRFKNLASQSKDDLVSLGFPSFTVEDFYQVFMETIEDVGKHQCANELLKTFQDEGLSNYIVVYLRLLTSAQLQRKSDFFENFIEGGRTTKEFCSQEVEPMARESDHIHIIALTDALGVCVRVVYVDRSGDSSVNHHDFPEDGSRPAVVLLYRPGHYDILYHKQL
ncbi:ubiquitin thioesterase OTUB1-like [Acropora muricata]|uniref:ubiquitin thioesterase OTUB1-like n=2 Tax=Acropora TaxID=6127 RepID=UPI0034E49848